MAVLFQFAGVIKTYGSIRALDNLSMSVPAGAIGLLGPNGSGKTTLIRTLLGLIPCDSGSGEVLGMDFRERQLDIRRQVGFAPEDECLFPHVVGVEFVAYAGELVGMSTADALQRAHEVLDYVREHGQDSETLNDIYVVDDQGRLIDDIRIREFLLAPLEIRVADLMDRRVVALKATDDQENAVGVFRQYDRSALPVTDTAGMLIGIVTIDDVLDVVEAAATKDIQRIGGSEALDEMRAPRRPHGPWAGLAALGFGGWVVATLGLVARGMGPDGRIRVARRTLGWIAAIAAAYALWVAGMMRA